MRKDRYIELLNHEIDGLNSPADKRLLSTYLDENAEAKHLYEDLVKISDVMTHIESVEPPPYLKKHILNSIPWRQPSRVNEKRFSKVLGVITTFRGVPAYAFTFAAGLAVAIIAFSLFADKGSRNPTPDISKLYGTIMFRDLPEVLSVADEGDVNLPDIQGTVQVRCSKEFILADLRLKTQKLIQLSLEFAPDDMSFSSFGQQDPEKNSVNIDKNLIRIQNTGANRFVVVFSRKSQQAVPISLKIFTSGSLLTEKALSVPPTE